MTKLSIYPDTSFRRPNHNVRTTSVLIVFTNMNHSVAFRVNQPDRYYVFGFLLAISDENGNIIYYIVTDIHNMRSLQTGKQIVSDRIHIYIPPGRQYRMPKLRTRLKSLIPLSVKLINQLLEHHIIVYQYRLFDCHIYITRYAPTRGRESF